MPVLNPDVSHEVFPSAAEEFAVASRRWNGDCQLVRREELPLPELRQLEQMAFQHSVAPEAYDVVSAGDVLLRSGCRHGWAGVHEDGRFLHVSGGVVAPEAVKRRMLEWLCEHSRAASRTVAVYSVPAAELDVYRDLGFSINKFGEEPVLELENWHWRGQAFEWVRRQTNFCLRSGLEVRELRDHAVPAISDELLKILADDLSDRVYSRPLHLLEGQFDPRRLHRRRLFVAEDGASGRVEGFLAISPMNAGDSWAFETYRKRQSAPRGTIPFLFRQVVDQLQREGVSRVSLCLVPGRSVRGNQCHRDDRRIQWLLDLWYRRLNFLFNTAGQDFFKSRFRPAYDERFLCVYPGNSVRSIVSFLKTAGALSPNWKNLCRQSLRFRNPVSR